METTTPNETVLLLDHVLLSELTDFVSQTNSGATRVRKKLASLTGTIFNLAGSTPRLNLQLEGSHDGVVWKTTGLSSLSIQEFGEDHTTSPVTVDYAWLRIQAGVSTSGANDGSVLFSASIVFAD